MANLIGVIDKYQVNLQFYYFDKAILCVIN